MPSAIRIDQRAALLARVDASIEPNGSVDPPASQALPRAAGHRDHTEPGNRSLTAASDRKHKLARPQGTRAGCGHHRGCGLVNL